MLRGVRIDAGSTQSQRALLAKAVLLLSFLGLAFAFPRAALAEPAQALTIGKAPFKITVLTGPRNDFCYSDHIEAIEKLVRSERDRINKAGGVAGRQIEIHFRNDEGDAKRTVSLVSDALSDSQTLALIGLQNSERAKEVFKELGPKITASGIPWISSIYTSSLIANYPNVYTMRGSQEEESIPVIAQFVKDRGFTRPAFIGLKGHPAIDALLKGLEQKDGFPAFAAKHLLTVPGADSKARQNAHFDPKDVAEVAEDLRAKNPDIIFLLVGGWRTPVFLKELEKAGISAPLFTLSRLDDIFRSPAVSYAGDTYQIAKDELPNLYNDRVRNRLFRELPGAWMFHGQRNPDAFERVENECQELPRKPVIDLFSRSNLRAIGIGLEYRDMLAMIAEIANSVKPAAASSDVAGVRQKILKGIPAFYSAGKGAFQGSLEDWAFRPTSRTAVGTSFIVMRPKEVQRLQLAPIQYVQLKGKRLRKIPALYLEIDLKRLYRIDDTEKTFNADFYLAMNDENNPSIDMIEFSNAFLDYKTGARRVTIEPLHEGGPSDTYPNHMKIYKVSGKFMLDPNYNAYPFDVQRFSIDLRPRRGEFPFIVQPQERADREFDAEGWEKKDAYVSYDQDFISILDTKNLEQSAIPFYKNSFVWVLKRSATDFYLRIVVPLIFIAIVAYLAIFIPSAHFEAIVTIQVTALLSAVALYITTPKIDSDTATLMDKIFIFNYMMYSLMIGISILRINKFVVQTLHLKRALAFVHIAFIPMFLVLMSLYIYGAGGGDSQSELEFWPALREGVSRLVVWLGTGSA